MSNWLDNSNNANTLKQSYIQGNLEVRNPSNGGGYLRTRNSTDALLAVGDSSFNGKVYLATPFNTNTIYPQPHSNADIFWNFAQNITTSTIGGDSGIEGTFRIYNDTVKTVTLTESEGFQALRSEQLRASVKNYVFPSDSFTIELYCKIASTSTGNYIISYTAENTAAGQVLWQRVDANEVKMYLQTVSGSGANIKVSDNNTSRVNATHLQIQNSDFSASACAGIMLAASNGANSEFNIVTQKHSSGTGADFHLDNGTDALMQISGDNGDIKFGVNGTMITSFTPGNGNTVTGIGVEARNGAIFLSRSDGPSIFANRNSHGEIIRFKKDGSSVGSISTNGNSLPSDKNFKKNISDLDLGLSLVNKLKPSQFNYKIDDPNTPVMYGLIAQELEESLTSEGITKNSTQLIQHRPTDNDKESDYDVDYAKLIPILINAVKELSAKVDALKSS